MENNIKVMDGKLYDGEKEIRPEIGNAEHIKALKEYMQQAEWLEEGCELMFHPGDNEEEIKTGLECLCGHETVWNYTLDEDEHEGHFADFLLKKKNIQCEKCKRKYKFYEAEFGIGIKLIKKN